nr:uncharacterized protein At1g51745-like [Ipomoea batatas]
MGSSGESSAKSIDASAGGLVWVRRRNGSWWPGRILGLEELPENSTISPRSGTPVKLLGREDSSVDWYNLEKSKRVKAFRCGEYDECIEKAKAAAANASKKVVKYARREDAILQALEIESACLGKDHPNSFSRLDEQDGVQHLVEELPNSPHHHEKGANIDEDCSSSEDNSSSAPALSRSGVSFEETNSISASKEQSVQGRRRRTPNDSEDDVTEGAKRMRGLDDLGMQVVQSLKRKRSQVAHVHEFLKKKSRRRTLMKVLESTALVSVPVVCEGIPSPTGSGFAGTLHNNTSDNGGIVCENGTLKASGHTCGSSLVKCKQENDIQSIPELPEDGSLDSLFDVPFVTEEKHSGGLSPIVSLASQKAQPGAGAQSSQSSQVETTSLGNDELNESGTSSGNPEIHDICQRMEKGTSEWQSKGKRNSRHTGKGKKQDPGKMVNLDDEFNARLAEYPTYRKSKPVTEFHVEKFQGWSRNSSHREPHAKGPAAELLVPQRLLPYRQSRFVVNPKYDSSAFSLRHHVADSSLFDVNLEVKSSYRPQHVPYISLMSKLNGQPIIGHPLTVDVLEDGFCDQLLASASEVYSSGFDLDDEIGENTSALQGVSTVHDTRPGSGGRVPPKHAKSHHGSASKSSKSKKNGLFSKKTRTLSSLTGSHKQSQDNKLSLQKLKGPAVACVPLKVVFSRISEALNSPMRATNRVIGTSVM